MEAWNAGGDNSQSISGNRRRTLRPANSNHVTVPRNPELQPYEGERGEFALEIRGWRNFDATQGFF